MSVTDFRTFIGDPIPYDSTLTPEELSDKVWYMAKLFSFTVMQIRLKFQFQHDN